MIVIPRTRHIVQIIRKIIDDVSLTEFNQFNWRGLRRERLRQARLRRVRPRRAELRLKSFQIKWISSCFISGVNPIYIWNRSTASFIETEVECDFNWGKTDSANSMEKESMHNNIRWTMANSTDGTTWKRNARLSQWLLQCLNVWPTRINVVSMQFGIIQW